MRWRSFVAIGDSFTEGLDDPDPSGTAYRGWADLVAEALTAQVAAARARDTEQRVAANQTSESQGVAYANLAVRGRLFASVVSEQVPAAVAMRPDLVSFAAGGNDVLRRGFDAEELVARFEETVARLRATGADVVLFRFADVTVRLPGRGIVGPRVARLNQAVADTAERHGATLVDLWADDEFANPTLWSLDRLHLSTAGHRRVAAHVLRALGVAVEPLWWQAPPATSPRGWLATRSADVAWAGRHLLPWVMRRLTGRSSGDRATAKRPTLAPLAVPPTRVGIPPPARTGDPSAVRADPGEILPDSHGSGGNHS